MNEKFKPTENEEKEEFNIDRDDDQKDDLNINCLYEKLEKDYDKEVDNIIEKSNEIISNKRFGAGLYQLALVFLSTFMWAIGFEWAVYVNIFAGYTPDHKCLVNDTEAIKIDKCTYLNVTTNQTVTCNKWIYDKSQMANTMITEYDLVCGKDYHFEFMHSFERTGNIFGIVVFSIFANHYGKRPTYFLVSTIAFMLGLLQYWLKNFYVYMSIGFLINFVCSSLDAVCFSLILEAFQSKYRTRYSMISIYIFLITFSTLGAFAHLINKWRELRLFVFIIIAVLTVGSYFLVQESITWLISIGRLDDAERVIEKIARINRIDKSEAFKRKMANVKKMFEQLSKYNENVLKNKKDKKEETNKYMEIIRNKKFLLYLVVSMFSWSMTGMVYDGLTYLNASIGENIFLNWFLLISIDLASQFVCHYFIEKYGRKIVIFVSLILAGGVTFILAGLNYLNIFKSLVLLKTCFFVAVKFFISISFTTIMIHTTEIFPTNIRSFCCGLCLLANNLAASALPILSIYLAKVIPWLPVVIYGTACIVVSVVHLYLPETVNRPLPNSIQDILSREKDSDSDPEKKTKAKYCCNKLTCNFF